MVPSRRLLRGGMLAVLAALVGLAACERTPAPTRVSFARRAEIPSVRDGPDREPRHPSAAPFRVGVAAMLSPTRTLDAYYDHVTHMGRRLGRPVRLLQRPTYGEINDLLRHREIEMAFICGGALPAGERDFGMRVLAVPQIRGQTVFYSYLVVNRHSAFRALGDLRAKSFALSDPLSLTGRLAPFDQLLLRGETPQNFFSRTVFTYGHDNSILAVAEGLVDSAAVGSHVYEYLRARDPDAVRETRVVARWGPYGNSPIVVHPQLDPALLSALRDLVLSLHAEPAGKALLDRLLIDRLVEVLPDFFDPVRRLEARAR